MHDYDVFSIIFISQSGCHVGGVRIWYMMIMFVYLCSLLMAMTFPSNPTPPHMKNTIYIQDGSYNKIEAQTAQHYEFIIMHKGVDARSMHAKKHAPSLQ
jgi:hypothetical protein